MAVSHRSWRQIARVWLGRFWLFVLCCAVLGGGLASPALAERGQDKALKQPEVLHEALPDAGAQLTINDAPPPNIAEVSPPEVIQELHPIFEQYHPQISILTPEDGTIVQDDQVFVQFQVDHLALFQDPQLQLGPHLQVFLDGQPLATVYDLKKPLQIDGLQPGSHRVLAVACAPWNESFKNLGAVAQLTFHVFTKTQPEAGSGAPQLIYNSPIGVFGAEPLLLDFFLDGGDSGEIEDPDVRTQQVRATVNGHSFVTNQWNALFLEGFKSGKNWIQLELLDDHGDPILGRNAQLLRLVNFQPAGEDALSRLIRGEVTTAMAQNMMNFDGVSVLNSGEAPSSLGATEEEGGPNQS